MEKNKTKDLSYEQAISRLEEIVAALENGNKTLDESVKLFEEGAFLSAFCNKALQEAEQKIVTLEQLKADEKPGADD